MFLISRISYDTIWHAVLWFFVITNIRMVVVWWHSFIALTCLEFQFLKFQTGTINSANKFRTVIWQRHANKFIPGPEKAQRKWFASPGRKYCFQCDFDFLIRSLFGVSDWEGNLISKSPEFWGLFKIQSNKWLKITVMNVQEVYRINPWGIGGFFRLTSFFVLRFSVFLHVWLCWLFWPSPISGFESLRAISASSSSSPEPINHKVSMAVRGRGNQEQERASKWWHNELFASNALTV